mmetsp:Transcript_30974/g.72258  ORF Transcript_30974/g.72258 Transcript_30974/m.72258 type:complete len:217 (+) Transcript_30974:89-739(+)
MSLSSFAASAIKQDLSRNVNQAIGKPFDGLTNSRGPGHSDINWQDFNYPPLMRLIHYDLEELPSHLCGTIRLFNATFVVTTVLCLINACSTVVIVISFDSAEFKWLLQSLLHLVLLPPFALAVFYVGYRGLVEPDETLIFRFKVGQPAAAVVYFLLGILPVGASGLIMLNQTNSSVFWMIVVVVESSLWLVNCVLACVSSYKAFTFDAYRGAGGQI